MLDFIVVIEGDVVEAALGRKLRAELVGGYTLIWVSENCKFAAAAHASGLGEKIFYVMCLS